MSVPLTKLLMDVGNRMPLTIGERLVLIAYCFKASDNGECFLGQHDIGLQVGMKRQNVQKIVARLRAQGLVEARRRGIRVCTEKIAGFLPASVGSGFTSAAEEAKAKNTDILTYLVCTPQHTTHAPDEHTTHAGGAYYPCPESILGMRPSNRQIDTSHTQGAREVSDVNDWAGFEAFRAAYPRPARSLSEMKDGWLVARGCGWTAKALLRALEAAKRSNQWTEEGGRYIPRPEVWLGESRYMDFAQDVAEADRARKDREWEAERIRRLIAQQEADEKALRSAQEAREGSDR